MLMPSSGNIPPIRPDHPPAGAPNECAKIGLQYADISVPITLKPDAAIGRIEMKCCGEPTVTCVEDNGANTCEIVITQKVSIKIPVQYSVVACVGESSIDCEHGCCK